MTPEEAADALDRPGLGWNSPALRVLIDHARATGHDAKSRGPEYWRGHADGKLEQQATTTPEIVTGEQAALREALALLDGGNAAGAQGRIVRALQGVLRGSETAPGMVVDGDVLTDVIAEAVPREWNDEAARALAERALDGAVKAGMTVLHGPELNHRAPEPVAPPAVGDTVETAAQLDALPVGAVLATEGGGVAKRHQWGKWQVIGYVEAIALSDAWLPARVLDLGGES